MIENLLWPKKLTEPPQLLVDVEALLITRALLGVGLVGFDSESDIDRATSYKIISVGTDGPDTFRMGFRLDVTQLTRGTHTQMCMTLPFQKMSAEIVGFRCHGYTQANANLVNPPDMTVEKSSLTNEPTIRLKRLGVPAGHTYLFKMESPEFEDNSSEKQFSSGMGYSIIYSYNNSSSNLKSEPEFTNMWTNYKTIVFESIIKVTVDRSYSPDTGFRIGVAEL